MLKNIKRGEWVKLIKYDLCFDDGIGNGFGFPCDGFGNLLPGLSKEAQENLEYCLAHPEKFARYNEVVSYDQSYREESTGTCSCGNHVTLRNDYMGATQCEKCGKWYNLFGQELLPPEYWEDDEY